MRPALLASIALVTIIGTAACHSTPSTGGAAPAQGEQAQAATAPAKPATPPAAALHLGEPITQSLVSLADVAKHPKDYDGKVIATSGTVVAVCQSMGCWMEIKDDAGEAHVKMSGHKFFVPKTSAGHHARVQARVTKTDPDEDCAEEAAEQTGKPVAKLELEATGVELLD